MHTRKAHTSASVHQKANHVPLSRESSHSSQSSQSSGPNAVPPSLKYDHSFSKDWDIIEAGAFEPLYGSSKRPKTVRASSIDYEAAQILVSDVPGLNDEPPQRALDSGDSFTSVATTGSAESAVSREAVAIDEDLEDEAEQEQSKEELEEESEEEEFTPITHVVDKVALRKAMSATGKDVTSYWAYTLYQDSAGNRPEVHYCTSPQSFARISNHFKDEPVLGFDLEWNMYATDKSSWWENVSVMQVSSQSHIAIFHLSEAVKLERKKRYEEKTYAAKLEEAKAAGCKDDTLPSDIIPENLVSILADPNILKMGVNILGDCRRLSNHCKVQLQGQFELSHLYRLVIHSEAKEYSKVSKKLVSMAEQAKNVLNLPLYKGAVRTSPWSQTLQKDQILYAASDAYAGLQLFLKLDERRRALKPRPPRPHCHGHPGLIRLGKGIELPKANRRTAAKEKEEQIDADMEAAMAEADAQSGDVATSQEVTTKEVDPPAAAERTTEPVVDDPETARRNVLKSEATVFADGWMNGSTAPKEAGKIVRPAYLKSYFLWHHKVMSSGEIASVLSIKPTTVDGYICSAIWMAKLPHDKDRFDQIPKPRFTYGARKRSHGQ